MRSGRKTFKGVVLTNGVAVNNLVIDWLSTPVLSVATLVPCRGTVIGHECAHDAGGLENNASGQVGPDAQLRLR